MINKSELKEGAYYIGTCRNTNVAKWVKNKFIFINMFFEQPYIENIPYYGDVKHLNTDGFIPIQEISIEFNEIRKEKELQDYKNYARKIYLNTSSKDLSGEKWEYVPNYEGLYQVSNLGRVKNCFSKKIMKQNFSREYLILGLTDSNHIRKTHRVHRLVAKAFNKNYDENFEVNHINGIKSDNRLINLEWVKHSDNSKHNYMSGNVVKKLTSEMVMEIKKMLQEGVKQIDIADKFKVSRSTICEINKNKKWSNLKL